MKRAVAIPLAGHVLLIALFLAASLGLGRLRPPPPVAVEPPSVAVVMGHSGENREAPNATEAPPPPQQAPPPQPPPPPQDHTPDQPQPQPPPPAAPPPPPPPPPATQDVLPPPPPPAPPRPPQPEPPKPARPAPAPSPPAEPPRPEPTPAATPPPAVNLGPLGAGAADIEDTSHTLVPAEAEKGNWPPAYPIAAARSGEHGTVGLRIHVGADGRVTAVEIAKSSGHPILDKAARDAILQWRYKPARDAAGNPVPNVLDFSVEFQLN